MPLSKNSEERKKTKIEVIKLKIEIMLGKIIVVIFTILFLETNNKILKTMSPTKSKRK